MLTSAINYCQCVRAGLRQKKNKCENNIYIYVCIPTISDGGGGKKFAAKTVLRQTAPPPPPTVFIYVYNSIWPRFYDAKLLRYIALTVPDGRTDAFSHSYICIYSGVRFIDCIFFALPRFPATASYSSPHFTIFNCSKNISL